MHTIIPVVAIVGRSGSGKTTMIEKLIPELKRRNYRVGTIKHHAHPDFEIDYEGKDSWRHMQAGSDHVILAAPNKIASIRLLEQPLTVENIVNTIMIDTDLVITDGYRGSSLPKLEIVRRARSLEPVCSPQELLGIITDLELENFNITHFSLDDIVGIAEFIEEKVIRSHQPPEPSAG